MIHGHAWLRQRAREEGRLKAILSMHARLRAQQMAVSHDRIAAIMAATTSVTDYPGAASHGHTHARVRVWDGDPEIRLIYDPRTSPPTIVTVVWNVTETFTRPEEVS